MLGASVLLVLLLGSVAMADYDPARDQTVSVQVLPGTVTTTGDTGSLTFETQETVHSTVTDTSGTSVDHYYIWVDVNGTPVLAIDPLCGYDFE